MSDKRTQSLGTRVLQKAGGTNARKQKPIRDRVSHDRGLNGRSIPDMVDIKVLEVSAEDGTVMLSVQVGLAPRALALDANNRLWVGCSLDDTVWEIDGDTGHCCRGDGDALALPPHLDRNPPPAAQRLGRAPSRDEEKGEMRV